MWTASFWRGSRWWSNLESKVEDLEGTSHDITNHIWTWLCYILGGSTSSAFVSTLCLSSLCRHFRVANIIEKLSTWVQIRQFSSNCFRFELLLALHDCDCYNTLIAPKDMIKDDAWSTILAQYQHDPWTIAPLRHCASIVHVLCALEAKTVWAKAWNGKWTPFDAWASFFCVLFFFFCD